MKFAWLFVIFATSANAADWWQNANFYQIYPRSFKDSDGDGVGDIRGILEKLDHLQELGVSATWLSPVLKSPQADFGYDIEDFKVVDELFGTNEDLYELFSEAHKRDIKVIMDFVPNHTSDKHEWFLKSVAKEPGYEDYYIWHDGRINTTTEEIDYPNNWQAVFKTRAWTWHPERQQYYLHQFDRGQPDLNFRNPAVVQEMKDVLTFWMDKGADGFRIDAINHMFEIVDFRDEPLTGWTDDDTDYGYTHHIYTKDLPETYEMVGQWKELIDKYNEENDGNTRVIFTEAYAELDDTLRYYEVANFPFNFALIEKLNENSNSYEFKNQIDVWLTSMPQGATANWVLGNHDKPRFASRYGNERVDGMMTLLLCLPGVAITYNGDEIGMVDHRDISYADSRDPQGCNAGEENYKWASRDPQRTPFQWDSSINAGFSTAQQTWIPIHPGYETLNLAEQKAASKSFYKFYQELASLRNHEVFVNGDFRTHAFDEKVFAFRRTYGVQVFYGLINFGAERKTVDLMEFGDFAPENSFVVVAGSTSSFEAGDAVNDRAVVLGAYDAIVVLSEATRATEPPTEPPTESTEAPTSTDSTSTTDSTSSTSTTAGGSSSSTTTSTTTTDAGCNLFASVVLLIASFVMIHFI